MECSRRGDPFVDTAVRSSSACLECTYVNRVCTYRMPVTLRVCVREYIALFVLDL